MHSGEKSIKCTVEKSQAIAQRRQVQGYNRPASIKIPAKSRLCWLERKDKPSAKEPVNLYVASIAWQAIKKYTAQPFLCFSPLRFIKCGFYCLASNEKVYSATFSLLFSTVFYQMRLLLHGKQSKSIQRNLLFAPWNFTPDIHKEQQQPWMKDIACRRRWTMTTYTDRTQQWHLI